MLVKKDFPIFDTRPNLIYLDCAATSQVPEAVIDAVDNWYKQFHANVHRSLYSQSIKATDYYERSRLRIANMFNVKPNETIFVRNTTEALNLLSFGLQNKIKAGDSIVISQLEHHSNILPWRRLSKDTGAKLLVIPCCNGRINLIDAEKMIDKTTKIVAIAHASNVFGTLQPIKEIANIAHKVNAIMIVDGAQAVPHVQVNPWDLGADAYAFSGHKAYGPTGIGVVFIKQSLSQKVEPFLLGGDMVDTVNDINYRLKTMPWRFEAGTPNSAGTIGLAKALELLDKDRETQQEYLDKLKKEVVSILNINNAKIISPQDAELPIISFTLPKYKADDLALKLDDYNIAIRSGYMCAQPLVDKISSTGLARISLGLWNTRSDILALDTALKKI